MNRQVSTVTPLIAALVLTTGILVDGAWGQTTKFKFTYKAPPSAKTAKGLQKSGGTRGGLPFKAARTGALGRRVSGGTRGGLPFKPVKPGSLGGRVSGGTRGGLLFKPVKKGKLGGRVSGGTRSGNADESTTVAEEVAVIKPQSFSVTPKTPFDTPDKRSAPKSPFGAPGEAKTSIASAFTAPGSNSKATPSSETPKVNDAHATTAPNGQTDVQNRVDSGTRSGGGQEHLMPMLVALSPAATGWTVSPSPAFHWYQSMPSAYPIRFYLSDPTQDRALLAVNLRNAGASGFRHIDLKQHNIKLEPGREYQWSVQLVTSATSPSANIFASGWVKLVSTADAGVSDEPTTDSMARIQALATAGVWYDALDQLSRAIDNDPENTSLLDARLDLLKQVGLN